MPFDFTPTEAGTWVLASDRARDDDALYARLATAAELAEAARANAPRAARLFYTCHFATCTAADRFRGRRGREAGEEA